MANRMIRDLPKMTYDRSCVSKILSKIVVFSDVWVQCTCLKSTLIITRMSQSLFLHSTGKLMVHHHCHQTHH